MRKPAVSVGPLSNESNVTNLSPCMWQKNSPPNQNAPTPAELSASVTAQAEIPAKCLGLNDFGKSSGTKQRTGLPIASSSSPSVVSVATDLTLGTFYDSSEEFRRKPNLQDCCSGVHNSESSRSHENSLSQISQSSTCSDHGKQMYAKDLEHQWGVLSEKVYWQSEAIQTISRTVSQCSNGNGRYRCSRKGSVWLSFLGPDKVGKRKIAASVAEIVFGRNDHLLYLDLSTQDMKPSDSIVDCYDSRYHKLQSERKTIVDYLAEKLIKQPQSVVLLENVEKADFVVRCSLSQAIKTGKLPYSRGKVISLNNHIFILASTVLKGSKDPLLGKGAPDYPEETVLEAKNLQMQLLVQPVGEIHRRSSTTCVSLYPSEVISDQLCSSKRKLMKDGSTKGEISKRACGLSRSFIDLNLPVDNMGEDSDIDKSDNDDDDASDNSEVWLEELLEHVDGNVVSKPFDFDSLSRKILREIDVRLRKIVGFTIFLEIDRQVIVQLLAAAWVTEKEDALEEWIEQVLCLGIDEARQRCNVASDFVLKLVPCEGLLVKSQASRVCLPSRIYVN